MAEETGVCVLVLASEGKPGGPKEQPPELSMESYGRFFFSSAEKKIPWEGEFSLRSDSFFGDMVRRYKDS